jgi:long-chain acyl-CoA synthetase
LHLDGSSGARLGNKDGAGYNSCGRESSVVNIALWLHRAGSSYPDAPAIGFGERVARTYGEFAARVARLAGAFRQKLRLASGESVLLAAANSPDYLDVLYAIWHAGLVAIPANAKLHGAELGYMIEHSGARLCLASDGIDTALGRHMPPGSRLITIGSDEYRHLLDADPVAVEARSGGDLAWLFYTSGTTGRPKGAMLSHRALSAMSHAYVAEVDETAPGDPILHAAPLSHGSGLYALPYVMRASVHVIPESAAFTPDEIFRLMRAWPRTSMFAAPTMVKRLVEYDGDCDAARLRTIVWGGAPMYVEDTVRALDRFGPHLAQIYGQGESPMTITALSRTEIADRDHPRWRERLASAGRPFSCIEVRVADAHDDARPAGETGEILCRGDVVMSGYWRNPEATAASLRGGWLHTGDVGAFDAEGYLYLKDRSKDLIISGGSNIYPREVEEVLLKHAGVREAAVIGRRDPEWGEIVVAFVVGEVERGALDALCLEHIARFKRPKDYVFVDALPKNNYGKILKTELRERDAKREVL